MLNTSRDPQTEHGLDLGLCASDTDWITFFFCSLSCCSRNDCKHLKNSKRTPPTLPSIKVAVKSQKQKSEPSGASEKSNINIILLHLSPAQRAARIKRSRKAFFKFFLKQLCNISGSENSCHIISSHLDDHHNIPSTIIEILHRANHFKFGFKEI